MLRKNALKIFVFFLIALTFQSCSSKKKNKRVVIWTNNSELVQYIELFNATHETKAVLVYKENPAASLPPQKNELLPDIVIAPYLKNRETSKNFESLDFLFDRKYLKADDFYSGLLKYGDIFFTIRLLPVSFNLPAIIFSKENRKFVQNDYTLTPENIFEISKNYTQRNSKGKLTKIGFSPLSSDDFIYTISRMKNTEYKESKKHLFTYNKENLSLSVDYLAKMTMLDSLSIAESNDFVYKYLSEVDTKRVLHERTLFAYTVSNEFFNLPPEQISKIDFRWFEDAGLIPVEDSIITMGISKTVSNFQESIEFISWFYDTDTQKKFLELKNNLTSDRIKFGIAGGFSAIKAVNEQVLPTYYKNLLSNIPKQGSIRLPDPKPVCWNEIKTEVIIPYIKESILSCTTEKDSESKKIKVMQNPVKSVEERFSAWRKQNPEIK